MRHVIVVLAACSMLLPASLQLHARDAAGTGALLSPAALMQTKPGDDSVKQHEERAAEKARLDKQISTLRDEVTTLRAGIAAQDSVQRSQTESRIGDLEMRIDSLSSHVDALTHEEGGDSSEWWSEDEKWDDEDSDWWDDKDRGQFNVRFDMFRKYPEAFRNLFPVDTRLPEANMRYNRAEGLYLGISRSKRQYWNSKPRLVSTASLGYAFGSHRWQGGGGLYVPVYFERQIIEIGAEYHWTTDSKDQWIIDRDENTIAALFAREDFMDYFWREGFSITASWYTRRENDLNARATIGFVQDKYESMERNVSWSLFGGDKRFRPVPPVLEGTIQSIVVGAGLSTTASLAPAMHGWSVGMQFEQGVGRNGVHASFSQATADLRRFQPLTEFLNFNARIRAVASDGDVPWQRTFDLGGPGTLPGYRYKEYSGTHGMLVNTELILVGSGLRGETRGMLAGIISSVNLILFADAGITNSPEVYATNNQAAGFTTKLQDGVSFGAWKSDAGLAVGNEDGNLRIGVAWRLDRPSSPALVLRFSRPF